MTVSALLTSRDVVRTYRAIFLGSKTIVILVGVLVALAAVGIVVQSVRIILLCGTSVGLLVLTPHFMAASAKSSLPTTPTTWTVLDDGLSTSNDIGDSVIKWSSLREVAEAQQCVLLKREGMWIVIPFRAFATDEERAAFVGEVARPIGGSSP